MNNSNKKKKQILSLLLSIAMIFTFIPFNAFALGAEQNTSANISITVSKKGVLAKAIDNTVMANRPVTVTDLNGDGSFTVDEALKAAHKTYMTDADYGTSESTYGTSVNKLWGVSTNNTLFFVNNVGLAVGVGTDTVKEGDTLVASINKDSTYYADWYTFFDKTTVTVNAGEEFTLNLKGHLGMAYEEKDKENKNLKDIKIGTLTDGTFKQLDTKATDNDGNVTLSFAQAGTYYVTASGTVTAKVQDWTKGGAFVDANCPIIAPACVVNVSEPQIGGNGFVKNIKWPLVPDATNEVIKNSEFDPNTEEYNIAIPDIRAAKNLFTITIDAKTNPDLYYNFKIDDGKFLNDAPKPMADADVTPGFKDGIPMLFLNNYFPIGSSHKFTIVVGQINGKNEFTNYDTYNYNITRSIHLNFNGIKVTDIDGNNIVVNDINNIATKLYVKDWTTKPYKGEKIKLTITPKTNTSKVYIGNNVEPFVNGSEINLADYKNGTTLANIPIKLVNGKVENTYNLYVPEEDLTPVISTQPAETAVDKNDNSKPLSVIAENPGNGKLTYQWFEAKHETPIKGATDSTYQPATKYAGSNSFYCIVTNTVNKATYTKRTDTVKYTVNLSELTAPEYIKEPYLDNEGKGNLFVEGAPLTISMELTCKPDYGYIEDIPYEINLYRSKENKNNGGTKVNVVSNTQLEDIFTITTDEQNNPGTWYYYVEVSVSKDGKKTKTNVSKPIAVIYKGINDVVQKLEGDGTEKAPFLINNVKDLEYVRDLVKGINTEKPYDFKGKVLSIENNIELPSDWEPIGTLKPNVDNHGNGLNILPFSGIINGNGNTLTVADHGRPLLGYARLATVKNLNLYGTHIDSNGLVENYVVDYGADGIYEDNYIKGRTIDIENVTIKSGSKILKSGFIGGIASGINAVNLRNCKIEKGVEIGYDKAESRIGSFAGGFSGTIQNCVSYADVYGVDRVGGIIGNKAQSMGPCEITNSAFLGTITATGNYVGGIAGSGYLASSAPNTPIVKISNCYVDATLTGKNKVGGIIGSEEGHHHYQETPDKFGIVGETAIKDNFFYGKIISDGKSVGGIIGALHDFVKTKGNAKNFYLENAGAINAIGSTIEGTAEGDKLYGASTSKLDFSNGTVLNKLNKSDSSYKNWKQGVKYPEFTDKVVAIDLAVSGEYKDTYYIGEKLDLTGLIVTKILSNGEKEKVNIKDLEITGFNSNERGNQIITLKLGAVETTIPVTVLKSVNPDKPNIKVTFTLLGDSAHGEPVDVNNTHTLTAGNLESWINKKVYEIGTNDTVKVLLEKALSDNGMTCDNPDGNYVKSITRNGVTLGEFTNGPKSGWMYTLNGIYSNLGVAEQFLNDGDVIVFHYTDDYTKDKDSVDPSKAAQKVDNLISAIGKVTLEKEAQIEEARSAYEGLPAEAQKLVTKLNVLEDAEKALAKLKGPVKPIEPTEKDKEYIKAYNKTSDFYTDKVLGFGNEWPIIGLARGGYPVDKALYEKYYQDVLKTLKNNNGVLSNRKYTEYSRTILALTAAGYDPTNVGGYNLVEKLADFDKVKAQGPNGSIWALIALDSNNYKLPKDATTTRDKLIADILANELAGGGWSMDPSKADVDMTGMALQALAPYYKTNADVKAAVDRALAWLSSKQANSGAFREFGGKECAESTAQVIVALTSLGINPTTDERFIKNGNNPLDGLMEFYVGNNQFEHLKTTGADGMATEQSLYALASYLRLLDGKTSLYDMTDVAKVENPKEAESPKTEDSTNIIPWMLLLLGTAGAVVTVRRKEDLYKEIKL